MARIKALKECSLFNQLGFKELATLAHHIEEKVAKKGDWLTKEGEPSNGLLFFQSGRYQISTQGPGNTKIDLGAGEYIGELSLTNEDHPRAVAVQCIEDGQYFRLSRDQFLKLEALAPDVAAKVAQGILTIVTEKMTATMDLLKSIVQS